MKPNRLGAYLPRNQVNKSILISLKNRFAYFRIPKVANSSLKHLIYRMESYPAGSEPRADMTHDINYGPVVRPAMLGFDSELFQEVLYSDTFFRFTFVRNPYAKALSNYLDRYMAKNSTVRKHVNRVALGEGWLKRENETVPFKTYLHCVSKMDTRRMEIHISPQRAQCLWDVVDFSFIGSFESLADDVLVVANTIWGENDVELGFQSPSRTNAATKLMENYDEEGLDLINSIYAQDFEAFSYRKLETPQAFSDPAALLREP